MKNKKLRARASSPLFFWFDVLTLGILISIIPASKSTILGRGKIANTKDIELPGNKEALALWYTVVLQGVRDNTPDLSARQMAILLTVYIDPKPYSIKMLSVRLKVSKPAVCRALDTLEKLKLVKRQQDKQDKRKVFVGRTQSGYAFLGKFSETILNNLAVIA